MNRPRTRTLITISAILLIILFYSHPTWLPTAAPVQAQPAPARVYIESPNGTANFTDLQKTRSSITFSVKIASAPSIQGFLVFISYNTTKDKSILGSPSIDYSHNVLVGATNPVNNCVANIGVCSGLDFNGATNGIDVLSLGLTEQCDCSTPPVTNGLLFNVTFQVNSAVSGIGQVHILEAQYTPAGTSDNVDATTYDGYYTNAGCPSPTPCRPPTVAYQITPRTPSQGSVASFNVTVTDNNSGGTVTYIHWEWGDASLAENQTDLSQQIQHSFKLTTFGNANCVFQAKCLVGLTVHDTYGIVWQVVVVVKLLHIFVDVSVGPTALLFSSGDSISQIFPGTPVHISANIRNLGTVPETANMTISTEFGVLNNSYFRLGSQGLLNASSTMNAVWDTSGLTPRVYSIFVTISNLVTPGCASGIGLCLIGNVNQTYVAQTDPSSTLSKTLYVLMLSPQIVGGFSLSLIQTVGLGVLVVVGAGAGLARFMKKPSYETEPI